MSHIFLDSRDGKLALYLNGDLQFDSRDERLYHEPLAFFPAALAARRRPGAEIRALILGGGDGLALREVLRVAEVSEAHLVDRDAEILRLGREDFAFLNCGAFSDRRAIVHCADARDYLEDARGFDLLIFDLTYPKELSDAGLFTVAFFDKARAALRPGGILALNAVSPAKTPEAFGCIGASLEQAGLKAVPYSFDLPSFAREGYGRWGFFFASDAEIAKEDFPEDLRQGVMLPATAKEAMRACPNKSDELLYYINNPRPLAWEGPFERVSFCAGPAIPGPRLTAAQGFGDWLRTPVGDRSLEELLRCVPLARRDQTRRVLRDWSHQAEVLFKEVDLKAFAEETLRRAGALPAAWRRELKGLLKRLRRGSPSLRELLQLSYRVFAVFLLVLLLANIFFPDNLYAKGFSSHYGGGSGSFSFTSSEHISPYRHSYFRRRLGDPRWTQGGSSDMASRTFDWQGGEYPTQNIVVADGSGAKRTLSSQLALSKEMQLLDSGEVAYLPSARVLGYNFILQPDRLRVLDMKGTEVLSVIPSAELRSEAQRQVLAQKAPLDKAMGEHMKWLGWVGWADALGARTEAGAEMSSLEALRKTVASAAGIWEKPIAPIQADPRYQSWREIFPGIRTNLPRTAAWAGSEGSWTERAVSEGADMSDADRFLAALIPKPVVQGPPIILPAAKHAPVFQKRQDKYSPPTDNSPLPFYFKKVLDKGG